MKLEELCAAVQEARYYNERFTRREYTSAFRTYTERFGPLYMEAVRETAEDPDGRRVLAEQLLDLLGDFALLGVRIKGRVWATRPGHFANTEFMKQLKRTIRKAGEKPRYTYDCRKPPLYDINDIRRMLPHRPPFLLVDRITGGEPGVWAQGIKCVTVNEPFFAGHFPGYHVMPGVLIMEALAQVGAVAILSLPENKGKLAFFGGIKNARFKRQVVPGDVLELRCELTRQVGSVGFGKAEARVNGKLAAQGELTFAVAQPGDP